MDAIKLLKSQHREVESLFESLERTSDRAIKTRRQLFEQLADRLAIHAKIEEEVFYPAANVRETEDALLEALEEHLAVKRLIADLLKAEPNHPTYMAKVIVLKELIEHHVEEEEKELFKQVKAKLSAVALTRLGEKMEEMTEALRSSEPRLNVPSETEAAPELGNRTAIATHLGLELDAPARRRHA